MLGSSTLQASPLALGSWRTFERISREDAVALIGHARDRGINFFDDARYDDETGAAPLPSGYSEVLFGEIFREAGLARADNVVSNKLWWEHWPRQSAAEELEESLERMAFEHVDLLYAVTLPAGLAVGEAVAQIAEVLAGGRARSWGVANWTAEDLLAAVEAAEREGIAPPCVAQLPYSVIDRAWVETPPMPAALEASGAGLVPSNVLAGGALTGKYSMDSALSHPESPDAGRAAARLTGALEDLVPALRAAEELCRMAEQLDATPAALAIAFALAHPCTVSVLFGATSPGQIDQNLAAVDLLARLSDADLARLQSLSPPA